MHITEVHTAKLCSTSVHSTAKNSTTARYNADYSTAEHFEQSIFQEGKLNPLNSTQCVRV